MWPCVQVLRDAEAALAKSEAKQRAVVEEVEATLQREGQVLSLLDPHAAFWDGSSR